MSSAVEPTAVDGEDDLWNPTKKGATTGHADSAFREPSMVLESPVSEDQYDEAQLDGHEGEAADAPKKSGSSIGVLAAVAVIGLCLVGGVGYAIKSKLASKTERQESAMAIEPVSNARAGTVSVFDAPAALPLKEESKSGELFDASAKGLAPALIGASAPTVVPGATPVSTVALTAASAPVIAAAPVLVVDLETPAALKPAVALDVPVARPVAPVATRKVPEVAAKVKTVSRSKPAIRQAAKPAPVRIAKAKRPVNRAVARAKGAQPAVAASSSVEEFMLPTGLKVQSVYPTSGKDVQAWISDASGRVEIVREGDALKSGVTVTKINAERGEVITTAGTITGRRSN